MITSSQNARIRLARALLGRARERREASAFVVEGVRLVEEAVNSGWKILFALYDETLSERGRLQVAGLRSRGVDVRGGFREFNEIPERNRYTTRNPGRS